jgi:hypothetical protein
VNLILLNESDHNYSFYLSALSPSSHPLAHFISHYCFPPFIFLFIFSSFPMHGTIFSLIPYLLFLSHNSFYPTSALYYYDHALSSTTQFSTTSFFTFLFSLLLYHNIHTSALSTLSHHLP